MKPLKVKDLIVLLQGMNPDAVVFMGYDGNIVVTRPVGVVEIASEEDMGDCWFRVQIGDVVILSRT